MNTGLIITVIVVIVLVAAVAAAVAFVVPWQRSRRLRSRFGPEYDRAVHEQGGRGAAERELAGREKRHAKLDLQPLSDNSRRHYEAGWNRVQEQFVDAPIQAVGEGHELLTKLMIERGYPTDDDDQRVADLSVEHAGTVDRYREARAISERSAAGQATTEELRGAMVHYRALFNELLGVASDDPADRRSTKDTGSAADRSGPARNDAAHRRGDSAAR